MSFFIGLDFLLDKSSTKLTDFLSNLRTAALFLSLEGFVYLCHMVLYNVTVSIDAAIEMEWLEWMQNEHIPAVMRTGCFDECKLSRVNGEEDGGKTYAVLYLSPSQQHLDTYQEQFAPTLQKDHLDRYQGRFAAFRTTLSVVKAFSK